MDPPLRSRFQALNVQFPTLETFQHKKYDINDELYFNIMKFTNSISILHSEEVPIFQFSNLKSLYAMIEKVKDVLNQDLLKLILESIYPTFFISSKNVMNEIIELRDSLIKDLKETSPITIGDTRFDLKTNSIDLELKNHQKSIKLILKGYKEFQKIEFESLTKIQKKALLGLILGHSNDQDICLIGEKAVGKSYLCKFFAKMFGYNISIFPMYSEMSTRDLFQKRSTDEKGNTIWVNSILIDAMIRGDLCVLDSIDRLNLDILLSLQTLLQNRYLFLFDGTRFIHELHYNELLKVFTEEELTRKKIFKIHPKFRIIATAIYNPKESQWMNSEILSLFSFQSMNELKTEDEKELLSKFSNDFELIDKLILFKNEYNFHHSSQKQLTIRDLKNIVIKSNNFRTDSIANLLQRSTMSFINKSQKESFLKLTKKYNFLMNEFNIPMEILKDKIILGELELKITKPENPALIPNPFFVPIEQHMDLFKDLLKDHILGHHSILIGNQGVGKNKVVDYFLSVIQREREYLQLHRDTTVNSLTVQPTVENGVLSYIDSPLVRAVKYGRILVLDEADKAPVEVVSIIKSLIEDGEMILSDRRRISKDPPLKSNDIQIHPRFRVIVLANRPGYPFHGNDFFRECGDIFSPHYLSNPISSNEITLLSSFGPNVPREILISLSETFNALRQLQEEGVILYPYSTRELVNIIKHLEKFPDDGIIKALHNVIDFDSFDQKTLIHLKRTFEKFGIPIDMNTKDNFKINFQKEQKYIKTKISKLLVEPLTVLETKKSTHTMMILDIYDYNRNPTINQRSELDNNRMKEFNELKYILKFKTHHTDMISFKDSLLLFNSKNYRLKKVDSNFENYKEFDLYPYLIELSDIHLNKISSFNFIIFSGVDSRKNLNLIFYDLEKDKGYSLALDIKKSKILDKFSEKTNSLYLYNKDSISRIEITENKCHIFTAKINNIQSVEWIKDNTLIITDSNLKTFMVSFMNGKFSYEEINVSGNHFCKINDQNRVIYIENQSPFKLKEIDFETFDISLIEFNEHQNLQKNHQTLFLDLTNQMVNTEIIFNNQRNFNIIEPKYENYRLIPLDSSISQTEKIIELSNGYLASLHQNQVFIWELDLHTLKRQSEYWSKYIISSNQPLSITVQHETEFKPLSTPKHGEDDDLPHHGGNTFAGGTGGRDTAGLGGYGGPYRLDKGHPIYQVPDSIKKQVSEESKKLAKEIVMKAYKKRLEEINMTDQEMSSFLKFYNNVKFQIEELKEILNSLKSKEKEKTWIKNLSSGEIDENKIVEGIIGEKNIYKKRELGDKNDKLQKKPKLIEFLFDVSASMYRFNGQDQRMYRMMEIGVLIMESFKDFESKIIYEIYGHSGEEPNVPFISKMNYPKNQQEELKIILKMHAHSQFCLSGDSTLESISLKMNEMSKITNVDEKILYVFSDANLSRYGITPNDLNSIISKDQNIKVILIFIASFADEATQFTKVLPNSYFCYHTNELIQVFKESLTQNVLN